jgi:hypothetical protein
MDRLLIHFVIETLTAKKKRYDNYAEEYAHDRYPQKDVVTNARALMDDILSQQRDNVALLARLVQKQEALRDATEDMEEVETFFKSQRHTFDLARKLQRDLYNEQDYFATDPDTNAKLTEIASILGSPKPYGRIKDLPGLTQGVKAAYGALLEQKKDEVRGIIVQCMGDVHTLAGVGGNATGEMRKSDDRFAEYRQKIDAAANLTVLDAMITQLLNYKDQVCKRIEALLYQEPQAMPLVNTPRPQKVVQMRRYEVFPVKRLTSKADVDGYLDSIRQKLYDALRTGDSIQIS